MSVTMTMTMTMLLPLLLAAGAMLHCAYAFPNVSLTVSPLWGPLEGPWLMERQLEIVWAAMPDADWFGIFKAAPPQDASRGPDALIRINRAEHSLGYYRTNVSFPRLPYPNGWTRGSEEKPVPGDVCMSFWAAAYDKDNQLLETDCVKIRPTWMGDNRDKLEILTLGDLFIPGTHNSGTYNRALMEDYTGEVIGSYVLTQDTDIWGQLVHGIRYLDLHIRHYPGSWQTTDAPVSRNETRYRKLVNVEAVTAILEEIKDYLKKASSEIVILDIHKFPPGFERQTSNHHQFIQLVSSILGEFVLPFSNVSYNSTLAEVWKTGKNLIVAYNNSEVTKEYGWLWSPIPRMWADEEGPRGLKASLQRSYAEAKASNTTEFWTAMAALEPTPIDFMFGGASSLRELASQVNADLARWFAKDWWKYASIVATDFFLGNKIIDAAVKACIDKANLAQAALEGE